MPADALAPALPAAISERAKQGFGSPVAHWVRGPLRELARDLLQPGCRCESWLDPAVVRSVSDRMWGTTGQEDWRLPLQYWSLLSFEWWLRRCA